MEDLRGIILMAESGETHSSGTFSSCSGFLLLRFQVIDMVT
jgi:hypothetical protein